MPLTEDDILIGENEIAAAIVLAGQRISRALDRLGFADAATPMGALEAHGDHMGKKIDGLSDAVENVAQALGEIGEALREKNDET